MNKTLKNKNKNIVENKYRADSFVNNYTRQKQYDTITLDKSVYDAFREIKSKLDYSLKDGQSRATLVEELLQDEYIQQYLLSNIYCRYLRSSKSSYLDNKFNNYIEQLANYILAGEDKKDWLNEEQLVIDNNNLSISYADEAEQREITADTLAIIQRHTDVRDWKVALKERDKRELRKINDKDIEQYDELKQKQEVIDDLQQQLDNATSKQERYKLQKMINAIKYEMFVVKEELRKPSVLKPKMIDYRKELIVDDMLFAYFDHANPAHIFALLEPYTERVTNNHTNYKVIYSVLKDKHKHNAGSYVYILLQQFEQMLEKAELTELERDIVDCIIERKGDLAEKHAYKRATKYINQKYKLKKENRYIKYQLEKVICKKISNKYY